MRINEGGGKESKKKGGRGKVKTRKGKKRCRQVCDLLKELEGSGGRRWFRGRVW